MQKTEKSYGKIIAAVVLLLLALIYEVSAPSLAGYNRQEIKKAEAQSAIVNKYLVTVERQEVVLELIRECYDSGLKGSPGLNRETFIKERREILKEFKNGL